jgi:hypothetical protein
MKKTIEAVENAVAFLEALGYVSGDVHDDLAAALGRLRKRQAGIEEAARRAEEWSAGVPVELRMEVKR